MVYKWIRCENEKKNGCKKVKSATESAKKLAPCGCGGQRHYSAKWYIKLQINGKPFDRVSSPKKDDALIEEGKLREQRSMGLGSKIVSGKLTIEQAYEKVYEDYLQKRIANALLADGTACNYRRSMTAHVIPHLGKCTLSQVDHILLQDYIEARKEDENPPAMCTLSNEIMAIRTLFKALADKRLYGSNPVDGFKVNYIPVVRDRVLSEEEVTRLLCECERISKELATIVKVALLTGLRKDGVLGLMWEHIDFEKGIITRTVKHKRSNGPKVVKIPINNTLREVLLAWRNRGKVTALSGLLFKVKSTGRQHTSLSRMGFNEAMESAEIEGFVFHGLRHTFITRMIEHGNSLEVVGAIAGHSSESMTKKYFHLTDKRAQEAMATFNIIGG